MQKLNVEDQYLAYEAYRKHSSQKDTPWVLAKCFIWLGVPIFAVIYGAFHEILIGQIVPVWVTESCYDRTTRMAGQGDTEFLYRIISAKYKYSFRRYFFWPKIIILFTVLGLVVAGSELSFMINRYILRRT